MVLSAQQVAGDVIGLSRTHANHLSSALAPPRAAGAGTGDAFADLLMQALNGVNALQQEADRVSVQFVTSPDSVETHDVTLALAKANMAVSITKAVVDRALRAYSDIISIR
jgi:flagellar hook-basal body complex protein FliE